MSIPREQRLLLIGFTVLAALAAIQWAALVTEPPVGRSLAVAALAGAAAAAMLLLGRARMRRLATTAVVALVVASSLALGLLALGFPVELLAPSGWSRLAAELGRGIGDLGDAGVPYDGESEWARLAMLLGMPLLLAAAALLAFWPGEAGSSRRSTLALLVLIGTFGYAASINELDHGLLWGAALTVAVCAWLFLPALRMPRAVAAAAMVAAAAALALPVAALLDADRALIDHVRWNYPGQEEDVKYFWDHTYEPLDWPRNGAVMLEAQSKAPHYWRTITLDHFDGFTWQRSSFPAETETAPGDRQNPEWLVRADVTIRGLDGGLYPSPGRALDLDDIPAVIASSSADGTVLANTPLQSGESYSILAYSPNPSTRQLREAPGTYPKVLTPYTAIGLPGVEEQTGLVTEGNGLESHLGLQVPPRGQAPDPAVERRLSNSAYGDVYRLAHRITAGEATVFGQVQAIQDHLGSGFTYDENPPQRSLPLDAFLLRDRRGYCQQFSGSMVLMLRMLGIPSRIAAGFAPGTPDGSRGGTFVIRDFDAHSWVEVYFRGIGWVTFDPTPSGAPATAPVSTAGQGPGARPGFGRSPTYGPEAPVAADPSGPPVGPMLLGGTGLLVLAATALFGLRLYRFRSLPPARAAAAQARELRTALPRLGLEVPPGATLLELEDRVGGSVRPRTAAYLARLRSARFGPESQPPPTLADRRALRRELGRHRGRIRAFFTLPPSGPSLNGKA